MLGPWDWVLSPVTVPPPGRPVVPPLPPPAPAAVPQVPVPQVPVPPAFTPDEVERIKGLLGALADVGSKPLTEAQRKVKEYAASLGVAVAFPEVTR